MAIRFREFAGTFMEHCHNTQHEDHAMLLRWDIEHPGQTKLMPAPIPTWDGVEYVDSAALPTFRTGDGFGPEEGIGGSGFGDGGETTSGGGGPTPTSGGTLEPESISITTAQYTVWDGEFRVDGTVSGALEVQIYDGGAAGGKCKGSLLATTDVGRGTFLWRAELATSPSKVCVRTPGGKIASASVVQIN
jgi:hypothetical protein